MKIIHCADLHLDSAMETSLPPEKAAARRAELFGTLVRMTEYARENGVSAIIIAGDMFDTGSCRIRTRDHVRELIENSPDIDFLRLNGNHDDMELFDMGTAPPNYKAFGNEWTYYRYGSIVICGCSDCSGIYDTLKLDGRNINIAVLHGQAVTGNARGRELINIPALAGKNIDYLALGHIHSYRCGRIDDRGIYCYCGCTEGRGFDECGEKGFVLIDTDGRRIRHKFVPFAYRTLHTAAVRVDCDMTNAGLSDAAEDALKAIPSRDMVRLVLTGETDEGTDLDIDLLKRRTDRFYFMKVKDETVPAIDYGRYRNDISLKGEFVRLVTEQDMDEDRKREIIMTGLRALSGREIDI